MAIQGPQIFNALMAGRQARQQEDYANSRNALAQQEVQNAPIEADQRRQLNALAIQGQQQSQQMALDQGKAKQGYTVLQYAKQSGDPVAFMLKQPGFAESASKVGVNVNDPQDVKGFIDHMEAQLGSAIGLAPGGLSEREKLQMQSDIEDKRLTGQREFTRAQTEDQQRFTAEQNAQNRQAQIAAAGDSRSFQAEQSRISREASAEQARLNREATAASKSPNSAQAIQERQRSINVYETARDGLLEGLEGTTTGPFAGRIPALSGDAQTAEGGVAAMAPVLKQLFRASGEGAFTDKDQELLLNMVPTRADRSSARKAKIANIDRIVSAKLGLQVKPYKAGVVAPAASGGGWSVTEIK